MIWAGLDAPDLPELRHLVWQAVKDAAIDPSGDQLGESSIAAFIDRFVCEPPAAVSV